jgi:hypothetical protein
MMGIALKLWRAIMLANRGFLRFLKGCKVTFLILSGDKTA